MYAPNTYNTPGSLTLKANVPMDYSRTVLSNKWQIKREAEPKDRELWSGDRPNLHQGTYEILGQQIPNTAFIARSETHITQEAMFESKKNHIVKDNKVSMVDETNRNRVDANLTRTHPEFEYDPTLPKHKQGHDKHYLETTYNYDYKLPDPTIKLQPIQDKPVFDNSFSHRRMISQFSDLDAPRRSGINTFHVQHGVYPNQNLKQKTQNNIF